MNWQEFAWNGIRFEAPANWQVGTMGPHYLLLEDDTGPALELKWGQIKGRFSHRVHLRRLAALKDKKIGQPVKEGPIPPLWQDAVAHYKVTGFSWQGQGIRGRGVLLYCTTCHTATLIQFYERLNRLSEKVPRHVLASFLDHREDNLMSWSLYDIRAILPEDFNLKHYRFEAGEFELSFVAKRQKLTLHRWGPASMLLSNRDLVQIARTLISDPYGVGDPVKLGEGEAVEWRIDPPATPWGRWWGRINRKSPFQWLRLWHLPAKNRILGVRIQGKKSINPRFLDWVCEGYESL
jgi:hypothetical protein